MSYHFLWKRGIRPARTEQFLVFILIWGMIGLPTITEIRPDSMYWRKGLSCLDSVYRIAAARPPGMGENPSERFSPPARCVKILVNVDSSKYAYGLGKKCCVGTEDAPSSFSFSFSFSLSGKIH